MNKRGFTLIEMLAVIAILALLFALGSKGIRSARLMARKTQAAVEMQSIETAVRAYVNKYGRLPVSVEKQGRPDPDASEEFSRDIIGVLTSEAGENNPAEIIFLEPQRHAAGVKAGTYLDPWGKQYLIWMDTDYDQLLMVKLGAMNHVLKRKIALVSAGLYELKGSASTNDLVLSWN